MRTKPQKPTIVGSARKVKPQHALAIRQEAIRLNGSLQSQQGFKQLAQFAEQTCGIRVNTLTIRHLLQSGESDVRSSRLKRFISP